MTDYKEKFEKMKIAGNLAARTLDMLTENIKEGVSTDYIDKLGYEFIRDNDIDWGTCHSNGGRRFGACGSFASRDSRVPAKPVCRMDFDRVVLLAGGS